ncbi:MAG: hypothetical protein Fur0043_09530 [Anaerolineales bacterium]
MPAGSFTSPSQMTVTISCISSNEKVELEAKVKAATGSTSEIYGAIRLEPSPFKFLRNVTLTIPLYKQIQAGKKINIYLYVPSTNPNEEFLEVSQAIVDSGGWTATGVVDHFSVFLLVGDPAVIEGRGEEPTGPPSDIPADSECNDGLGCIDIAPGESVRIASLLEFSGNLAGLSTATQEGVDAAIRDFGTIGEHSIQVTRFDGGCNEEMGANAALNITADPQIAGVVGTLCSASAQSAQTILSDAAYVMVSPGNTRTSFTYSDHRPGYFRVSTPDVYQAQYMAEFAYNQLGTRQMVIYFAEGEYGKTLAASFAERFVDLGGRIAYSESVPVGQSEFSAQMYDVVSSKAEAIYMPLFAVEAGIFTGYAREFGVEGPLLGAEVLNSPDFFQYAGSASENVYFTDVDPSVVANPFAYGYDATYLLLEAISRIAITEADGTLNIGRQAVRDALYDTSLNGKTGPLACDAKGDCGHAAIVVYRIQNDQPVEVNRYTP